MYQKQYKNKQLITKVNALLIDNLAEPTITMPLLKNKKYQIKIFQNKTKTNKLLSTKAKELLTYSIAYTTVTLPLDQKHRT